MSKELKALQTILGICVAVLVFYLLKDIDYYGAAGIGILWGMASFLGVQALSEWSKKRKASHLRPVQDKDKNADRPFIVEQKEKPRIKEPDYPIKDWTSIKSSLYVLKINLEDMDDPQEKKKLAQECMSILKRYDALISDFGDKIPEDEKLGVLEDLKSCSSAFQDK